MGNLDFSQDLELHETACNFSPVDPNKYKYDESKEGRENDSSELNSNRQLNESYMIAI